MVHGDPENTIMIAATHHIILFFFLHHCCATKRYIHGTVSIIVLKPNLVVDQKCFVFLKPSVVWLILAVCDVMYVRICWGGASVQAGGHNQSLLKYPGVSRIIQEYPGVSRRESKAW